MSRRSGDGLQTPLTSPRSADGSSGCSLRGQCALSPPHPARCPAELPEEEERRRRRRGGGEEEDMAGPWQTLAAASRTH